MILKNENNVVIFNSEKVENYEISENYEMDAAKIVRKGIEY